MLTVMCGGDTTKWDHFMDGPVTTMLSTMDYVIKDQAKQKVKTNG